jgi:hypothetical protein
MASGRLAKPKKTSDSPRKKEGAGFASGPKALGNGGVSSREDMRILALLGKKIVNGLTPA